MKLLERAYGSGPIHLIALLVSFTLAAYALIRIFANPSPISVLIWLVGAIVAHDFVLLPLYTVARRAAYRAGGVEKAKRRRVPVLAHLAVPTVLAGLLFIVWFPLILGLGAETFRAATGLDNDVYLSRWLAITAGLYLASAAVYAMRYARARGTPEVDVPERAPEPLPGGEHGEARSEPTG